MDQRDPPLRNCVKKMNDAWSHATKMIPKEICLSPIPAGEFIYFDQNAELIFSNLSAAAAFFGYFFALKQKSDKTRMYYFRILPEILS